MSKHKAGAEPLTEEEAAVVADEAAAQQTFEKTQPRHVAVDEPVAAGPVTLHLMDVNEVNEIDVVSVDVRPLTINVNGANYQQVRPNDDGSWVYRQFLK